MKVTARMRCSYVGVVGENARNVYLAPVYSDDKSSPNYSYSQATPGGQVHLLITNPAAWAAFEQGGSYDITFEPTPKDV